MAKIDISKIEGYGAMTAEQKLAALLAYEHPDPDYSGFVKKEALDRATSEAAEWKRKHNALLSEDQQEKQAAEERFAAVEQERDALRTENAVYKHKAKFLALGYSETLASETAQALAEGDTEKVFANQQKFLETYAKGIRADALKGMPRPSAGTGSGTVDYAQKAVEARESGDMTLAAYYTRMQALEEAKTITT